MIEFIQEAEDLHRRGQAIFIEEEAYNYLVHKLGKKTTEELYFGNYVALDDAKVAVEWIRLNHPEYLSKPHISDNS